MLNYYKVSKKAFKKYIKQNPHCTREEWDNYAHKNCLFSAFTLEAHEIADDTLKLLIREKNDVFRFLKEMFIVIPDKRIETLNKIIRINKEAKEEKMK